MNGHLGGFEVAHLADQYDVRVLTHDRAKGAGECQTDFRHYLYLADAWHLVLDRVLDGHDVDLFGIEFSERGIQRCCFPTARRSGKKHDAVRARQQVLEDLKIRQEELIDYYRTDAKVQRKKLTSAKFDSNLKAIGYFVLGSLMTAFAFKVAEKTGDI